MKPLAALVALTLPLAAACAEKIALVGGTAINPADGKITEHALVLINGDSIESIASGKEAKPPAGYKAVDCTGKFILPGYIDTHVHFFQSGDIFTRPDAVDLTAVRPYAEEHAWIERNLADTFARYLRCGITSVVDVGGPMWNFRVRELSRSGTAPRVAVAGPLISSVARPQLVLNDDPPIVKIDTPEQAVQLVNKLAGQRPDYIKIWYIVPPPPPAPPTPPPAPGETAPPVSPAVPPDDAVARATLFRPIVHAVAEQARRLKLRVAVHATELEAARISVEEGASLLVHSVTDKPVDEAFVRLMKERGTMLTPTLVVFERYSRTFANRLNFTPEEKAWGNPEVIASLDVTKLPPDKLPERIKTSLAGPDGVLKRVQQTYDVALKNLKTLQEAGIPIAAGTDAGNIGTLHGPSLFREFQLMKEAGLSPMQILQSTTSTAAKAFGGETGAKIGILAPGKFADLVVLNSNPVEDIARASDIHTVIKGGVVHAPDSVKME